MSCLITVSRLKLVFVMFWFATPKQSTYDNMSCSSFMTLAEWRSVPFGCIGYHAVKVLIICAQTITNSMPKVLEKQKARVVWIKLKNSPLDQLGRWSGLPANTEIEREEEIVRSPLCPLTDPDAEELRRPIFSENGTRMLEISRLELW